MLRAVRQFVAATSLAFLARGTATAAPSSPPPLQLPNGCVIEAIYFQESFRRDHPDQRAGILICELPASLGDHALVAYTQDGRIGTFCSLLGHRTTRLPARAFADGAVILCDYREALRAHFAHPRPLRPEPPSAREAHDDDDDATTAAQVRHAARALHALKVKTGLVALEHDRLTYALLIAWRSGVAIYTPATGTILTGRPSCGTEDLTQFARQHLGFTPTRITYEPLAAETDHAG